MKHFILVLIMLFGNLNAMDSGHAVDKSKHTDQKTIATLSPAPAQSGLYPDTDIDIVFTVPLDEAHIKHNALRLRQIDGKKITVAGTLSYLADEKRLRFVPSALLEPGMYEIDVMAIKPVKPHKKKNIKNFTYRFSVTDVQLVSLKINPSPIEVNIGSSIELNASVLYSDGQERTVKADSWSSGDNTVFSIETNGTATGIKEGQTTIMASYKGLTSKVTEALVYLEINGHRLPFEPNSTVNNSTLLGIDANANGVRDDVERRLYLQFKHPVEQAYMMQYAKRYPKVLKDPIAAADSQEVQQEVWNLYSCKGYLRINSISIPKNSVDFMENAYLNTRERMSEYIKFNQAMSGSSHGIPLPRDADILNCDFNITKMLEME